MSLLMLASRRWVNPAPPPTLQIGDPYEGGFYAGNIVISGIEYRLIVADVSAATTLTWKVDTTADPVNSLVDGWANCQTLNDANHPAVQYCRAYNGGGFTDWYLPSINEREVCYRNLKPSPLTNNMTGPRPVNTGSTADYGVNPDSRPVGVAYTATNPGVSSSAAFSTGSQKFPGNTNGWTSTVSPTTPTLACSIPTGDGGLNARGKTSNVHVRPIRKVLAPAAPPPSGPPGTPYGGGYYVGVIVVDGQEYYLITADKLATAGRAWKTTDTEDAVTFKLNDGLANSNLLNNADHPAIQYARAYNGGGFTDWYLPSRDELELAYRNLKPTAQANSTANRAAYMGGGVTGQNDNSNPVGAAYTSGNPARTSIAAFQNPSGDQFFEISPSYWTSNQGIGSGGVLTVSMYQGFFDGGQDATSKTNPTGLVRPFRRVAKPTTVTPSIGDPYEGGYYAGKVVEGGVTYNLVLAPKYTEVSRAFKTADTLDTGNASLIDGLANSNAMDDASHPAAQYCRSLSIGGKSDWYLASRDEWETVYRNLKPSSAQNVVAARPGAAGGGNNGVNSNSSPVGAAYTATVPGITAATAFQTGGLEALTLSSEDYWTSTASQDSGTIPGVAVSQSMPASGTIGWQRTANKTSVFKVRAIRKVPA